MKNDQFIIYGKIVPKPEQVPEGYNVYREVKVFHKGEDKVERVEVDFYFGAKNSRSANRLLRKCRGPYHAFAKQIVNLEELASKN